MAEILYLATNRSQPQRYLRTYSFPPDFLQARPFWPSVRARATYQEAICRAIHPLDWSNLFIRWAQRTPPQPHGEARILAGTPAGFLSEGGFSFNKSETPSCQSHPSLGNHRPGNHLKKYCNQRPHLDRLLLPPPARWILQGRYQHRPDQGLVTQWWENLPYIIPFPFFYIFCWHITPSVLVAFGI